MKSLKLILIELDFIQFRITFPFGDHILIQKNQEDNDLRKVKLLFFTRKRQIPPPPKFCQICVFCDIHTVLILL